MQLRCTYCQTMFAISREETLAGLEHLAENNLKYYDAHCPNCRRANRVERFKLELSYPDWQKAIKTMAKDADKSETEQESQTSAKAKPAATVKKAAIEKAAPKARTAAKSANKTSAELKPAAAAKKPAAKKPAPAASSTKSKSAVVKKPAAKTAVKAAKK